MTRYLILQLLVKLHLLFLIYFSHHHTGSGCRTPLLSKAPSPPQASNFADQRTKDNLLSPPRDACRPPPPQDAPACAARVALSRANRRGLPAAAAPLGPEDALAEAQSRRPSDLPDARLLPYPGSIPVAKGWAYSLWGRVQTPEGQGSSHPTRTHHAAPRSPRVCAPTARRPTRAVQSGLRVTKSRARLQPDPDRRKDPGTHRPFGVRTKFQSSLPCEGKGLGQRGWPDRARWAPRGAGVPHLSSRDPGTAFGGHHATGPWLQLRTESLEKRGQKVPPSCSPSLEGR